jgi:hypothetical protein
MRAKDLDRAVAAVEEHGVLLVYPLRNAREPLSLWHVLHPKSEMRWAWDADADPRISAMWDLRERLARSPRVVYGKWLGGRATFFARGVFTALLARLRAAGDVQRGLSRASREILDVLHEDSPLPTKALRELVGLAGRAHEGEYARATRALWSRLLVVGAGEVAEGGFPSLAVGATELLFEDLWSAADDLDAALDARLDEVLARSPAVARTLRRVQREIGRP